MSRKIHLIAPAGGLHSFYKHLGVENGAGMVALFQEFVGDQFELSANLQILDANEDELRGGRFDDAARAHDITQALADDNVAAIIAVRGGAWFTRILPRIDFGVLDQRISVITVFGFSELTPLVNIVASHPNGRGIHDIGPAFLVYGLKHHAARYLALMEADEPAAEQSMLENLRRYIAEYFAETVSVLQGREIYVSATLARGKMPEKGAATFVGGNLTVLSTLIGSCFERCLDAKNRWLLLEDFNDKLERFDRFLAHFTLAGYWRHCNGLLLGDFHKAETNLRGAVLAMLEYHITDSNFPVLVTGQVGHVYPVTPVPLHQPGDWKEIPGGVYQWGAKSATL